MNLLRGKTVIIKKTVEFDSAHLLSNHMGGCQNLHGHTYKMIVGVSDSKDNLIKTGSSTGMIIDFKDLKKILNDLISKLDHAFIYNSTDEFQVKLATLLQSEGKRTFEMSTETTVENMTQLFMTMLKKEIPHIHSMEIWETPTSSCYLEATEV